MSKIAYFYTNFYEYMENLKQKPSNIFLTIHPLLKFFISLALSVISFVIAGKLLNSAILTLMISWIVFSFTFLLLSWIVIFTRPLDEIKKHAKSDDGSVYFVFLIVLLSSFASMCTVLFLMISKDTQATQSVLFLPSCITGMILSWLMLHTTYIFHYAHEYYDDRSKREKKIIGGLDFPGDNEPDYLDFAYFSLVLGCTFQVSDVEITSQKIRRIALLHGLLAFALNTFVVALTINLIAGLNN